MAVLNKPSYSIPSFLLSPKWGNKVTDTCCTGRDSDNCLLAASPIGAEESASKKDGQTNERERVRTPREGKGGCNRCWLRRFIEGEQIELVAWWHSAKRGVFLQTDPLVLMAVHAFVRSFLRRGLLVGCIQCS